MGVGPQERINSANGRASSCYHSSSSDVSCSFSSEDGDSPPAQQTDRPPWPDDQIDKPPPDESDKSVTTPHVEPPPPSGESDKGATTQHAEPPPSSDDKSAHAERQPWSGESGSTQQADRQGWSDESAAPPTQQMDRQQWSDEGSGVGSDHGARIPAGVFERDQADPKDWSMMSTESVFGLQVAPSCDFTGYFLAHPELMDIATPPRPCMGMAVANDPVLDLKFESIPEQGEARAGNFSFAFPNLIDDKSKRFDSKRPQDEMPPSPAAIRARTTVETAEVTPAVAETSSKPEEAKGGLLACFPCCSC